ncbi:GNAT family N-acetyltransferase [Alkalihalobacillus deserti]|uniref:GNAT family N-acetyltransferase n=1 Tax=Alkalihalobacillus deserti TaxID=2879466 RepID=UPI001D15AC75|nr:GNAT family N-acetyltransferase [Alkalihalobacillus deserti]
MLNITYVTTLPPKEVFFELYQTTGWIQASMFNQDELYKAMKNSWCITAAYDNKEKLVGFGRVISDGVYQSFITDMMVHPDYQKQGIGSSMLKFLIEKCRQNGMKWIQLSCAQGKMDFYTKHGFSARPVDGPGMQIFL